MPPPSPAQIKQYKADGTWAERVARAREIGNDRVDPALVAGMKARLWQGAAEAAGLPAPTDDELAELAPPSGRGATLPAKGTVKVLVVLVDFAEYPHAAQDTVADVYNKFFGDGDSSQFPYESLRNYYRRASYGQLEIQGNVLGWYRAPHSRGWYDDHDTGFPLYIDDGEETLVESALNYFNGQGHDFTQYDANNDGSIDSLFILWTGPDNGWSNFWWAKSITWPHGFLVPHDGFEVDGKEIKRYVWSWLRSPWNDTSVFQPRVDIHETGHQLGLPDYYDYDGDQGPDGGVGDLDMMDGNWGDFNCFSKFLLEWLTPTYIVSGDQMLSLRPSGTAQDCVLIMPSSLYSTGNRFDEFYMAQYRRRSAGNDSGYPTDGFTIWHIDSTLSGSDFAYDNSYTNHKLIRLMEADGLEEIESNGRADSGDFYKAGKAFGNTTTPSSKTYSGAATNIVISQFTAAGSTMGARFAITSGSIVVAAGASLVSESFAPANQTIDPGETVTVNLSLQNVGTANSASVVGTLQPIDGVFSPSSAQTYGVMTPFATPVSKSFTFVAAGDCGSAINATLKLQDGALITFPLRIGAVPLEQNFDGNGSLPSGWTATVLSGDVATWCPSYNQADTPPLAAFTPNAAGVSDNVLESPSLAINSATTLLTFRQWYDLDSDYDNGGNITAMYDGGVLEIAIAGAAYQDILAAGGEFVNGGYNGTIPTGWENPLGNRAAWMGNSNGFVSAAVYLPPSAAGQSVKLRWRLGTDNCCYRTGWYIDTVSLRDVPWIELFDNVAAPALPANWSASKTGEVTAWATSAAESDSGLNAVFSAAPATVAENRLYSPTLYITSPRPQLTFRQHYNLENGYDGGILEISIDGGTYTDILVAGGTFAAGGYTRVISSSHSNPLAGKSAWSGNSSGYITTVADLPPAAIGRPVRFRWRMGSDNSNGGGSWYIDDVALTSQEACRSALMEAAGSSLVAESYQPFNLAIDPHETVTVGLTLRNAGRSTTNLIGTLLAGGGVSAPSGAQSFGATSPGGAAVTRNFSFTAETECGSPLTLTLQLQDGTTIFPPVTFTLTTGQAAAQEDFDAVATPALPTGWTAAVATGNVAAWRTSAAAADTGFHSAFAADPAYVSDNALTSTGFAIGPAGAQLTFRHYYDFDSDYDTSGNPTAAWDGGVLEIAIGSGAFTDIVTAGGSFLSGGYNFWLQGGYQNPVGNRWGWGGRSNGFTTTVVNLPPAAAGQTVRLRWRLGSDSSVPGLGWYVDSVSLRTVLASEYFDLVASSSLPSGWTATAAVGNPQRWSTSQPADSGPNAVYSVDPASRADNRLDSPPLAVTSMTPQLAFRNYYALESGKDGGVLEMSVAGGPFVDIATAGGIFTTGGYNGTIAAGSDNPLAGRAVWTGDSGGFIDTVVDLPVATLGKTVQFRWRMGSDSTGSGRGWFVDNVALVGGCSMPVYSVGDFDGDGDVDQEDFGIFQTCLSASFVAVTDLRCEPGRMDGDSDVDQADLAVFLRCHTLPGVAADPDCRNP